jgi:PAS domain S-box-containing protein
MPLLPEFTEIADQAPDAIALVDTRGVVTYTNRHFEQLFGFSREELSGRAVETLIPERYREVHVSHRRAYARKPTIRPVGHTRLALKGLRADGSEFPAEIHLAPVDVKGPQWTMIVIRDATQQHRLAAELREASQVAEESARLKSEFLSNAAHDLSYPMESLERVIGAFRRGTLQEPEIADLAATASASLERVRELLKVLIEISRLESGTMRVNVEPVQVSDIYADLERRFGPMARAKALHFTQEPCGYIIEADPALLRGMLSHLVTNAIRYTSHGEVRLACRGTCAGSLQLGISDTGMGIPQDQLHLIFDDFYWLEAARQAHPKGYGLGLGIVRRLSKLLGFAVTVQSSVGQGSVFTVEIPAHKVHPSLPLR